MIKKIKSYLLIAALVFVPAVAAVTVVPTGNVSAACTSIANKIGEGASSAVGAPGSVQCGTVQTSTTGIQNLARDLVNIFSIIVGIAAVLMIIYGGFRYITSGGDSGSVGNAKNTLIYAIVGLIIVALAQIIVRFVLGATSEVV